MFAVIRTGGRQYKVAPDDVIVVERLAGDPGAFVEVGDVLMVGDGSATTVGKPVVEGARVAAEIIDQSRDGKITVLKFKRRKNYRRTLGHRQDVTVLRITEISAPGMKAAKAAPRKAAKAADAPKAVGDKAPAKTAADKKVAAKKTGSRNEPKKTGAKKAAAKKTAAKSSAKKTPAKKVAKSAAAKKES